MDSKQKKLMDMQEKIFKGRISNYLYNKFANALNDIFLCKYILTNNTEEVQDFARIYFKVSKNLKERYQCLEDASNSADVKQQKLLTRLQRKIVMKKIYKAYNDRIKFVKAFYQLYPNLSLAVACDKAKEVNIEQ